MKNKENIILSLNLASLVYFIILVILSYYPIEMILFNSIAELITIPLLIFLAFSTVYAIQKIRRKEHIKIYYIVLIVSFTTIAFLSTVTIIQMR